MLLETIKTVSGHLKKGSISETFLFNQCLKRAELTKQLNAFITVIKHWEPDTSADRKEETKLQGIPIAVKDNFCIKGIKTTCGSRMLENFIPTYNATVVEKLIHAGARIIGKCNLDEFAMGSGTVDSIHGPTMNVWRSEVPYTLDGKTSSFKADPRIAGGSSGGSAVAVATGAAFASIGSDTGGSTRHPAAHTGIIGFKPTYSSVSRHGLIPLVNSMDVPGIMARSVEDVAIVYNVIQGEDLKDSTSVPVEKVTLSDDINPVSLKIGIPIEFRPRGMSEEVIEVWDDAVQIFKEAGSSIQKVSLPHTPFSLACYSVLNRCEVASNMCRYDGLRYGHRSEENRSLEASLAASRSFGFGRTVRSRILSGNYFLLARNYSKYFQKALQVRRLICEDFNHCWTTVDLLLTPTTLTDAPRLSTFKNDDFTSLEDYCTQPANMTGCPAISVPLRLSKSGLPLSIQLMAPNFKDDLLLRVAAWFQKQSSFPKLELIEL